MVSVKVHGGKVSGETGRIAVPLGTPVVLSVSSDVADEIHVHGYDRKAKVPAGTTASVAFTTNIPGVFEVELEDSKLPLLQLQVG
jgi:heme/copper-type cytochrome/quinol oxidase subunit 2